LKIDAEDAARSAIEHDVPLTDAEEIALVARKA